MMDNYIPGITPIDLLKRIEDFRNLNINLLTDAQLRRELTKLFVYDNNGEEWIGHHFDKHSLVLPKGTPFYRVRIVENLSDLDKEQDFWNNPMARPGRLNDEGEQVLYLCCGPNSIYTAVNEVKVNPNQSFVVISYASTEEIQLSVIGEHALEAKQAHWSDLEKTKRFIIDDFLKTEFSRDVGIGTEYYYRLSRLIAKSQFSFGAKGIEQFSDGVIYPSVKTKSLNNACMYIANARTKLGLLGGAMCEYTTGNEDGKGSLSVKMMVKRVNEKTMFLRPTRTLIDKILPCYKGAPSLQDE